MKIALNGADRVAPPIPPPFNIRAKGCLLPVFRAAARRGAVPGHAMRNAASVGLVAAIYHAARHRVRAGLPLAESHPFYEGWHP